jgi:hypothetical protein
MLHTYLYQTYTVEDAHFESVIWNVCVVIELFGRVSEVGCPW